MTMQEHMAIDVNPGPIRPIRLISDYFPHFSPFAEPTLRTPAPLPAAAPTIRSASASRQQSDPEPDGDSDDSTALGTHKFTLLFDADNSALHCTAHCAKGLKPPASGSVDTYVKANLLPGTSKPAADAQFGAQGDLSGKRCSLITVTYHGFTRQDAERKTLRSFSVCLEKWRPTKRPKSLDTSRGMALYEEAEAEVGEEHGRILLALCYSSQPGGLLVAVLRCAHLAPMDTNGYSDPFVRLFLHPNVGKKSKYKTSIRKKTLNPEFNEEFFYPGPLEELAQKTLLVSVWDYDLGTANDFIGGVQLSAQARGERQRHWRECLGRSDHRLELWHPLVGAPPHLSN